MMAMKYLNARINMAVERFINCAMNVGVCPLLFQLIQTVIWILFAIRFHLIDSKDGQRSCNIGEYWWQIR